MDRRPRWVLLVGLFVAVSAAVLIVALATPFEKEAPAAADVPAGDAARGEALFAQRCQGCHGEGGVNGGVGPALVGTGLDAGTVAGVVANGRGAMPPNLFQGQEAADVTAYVVAISGGRAAGTPGTTTTATDTVPAATTPATPAAEARLVGRDLVGLRVVLGAAAPREWTVWLDGDGGLRAVGTIPAGGDRLVVNDVGAGSLIDAYDRIIVGADSATPALVGVITPERAAELRTLLVGDPDLPGGVSTVAGAASQVRVMRQHIGFLVRAQREGNFANIRFHGEHMVNIAYGNPPEDIDGLSGASNPGDGVGLLGREARPGYVPRIAADGGPQVQQPASRLSAVVAQIAREGRRAATAGSVAEAKPFVDAIARRDAALATQWAALRAGAQRSATVTLEAP